jgi:hypothetical protein
MRPFLAFTVATAALISLAAPASAQTGEQIFRGILEGLLTPQTGQQARPGQPQTQPAARFDISDLRGRAACSLVFTGSGDTGAVQPQSGCPGALGTAASWRRVESDLEVRNAANQIVWRGEANGEGWTGGAADTLRVYTVKPGAALAAGPAAGAAAFDPNTLFGDWRAAEPGQTRGCRVTFVRPDPSNRYAVQNGVRVDRGCPAFVGGATNWFFASNVLTLTDAQGNVLAELTRTSADRWIGTSDDIDINLTRL